MAKGQSLVSKGIGIMVAAVVIVGVSIPVVQDVINSYNFTGITATILGFVPVGLAVGVFVASLSLVR